jgi:hypothetical protein
MVSSSGISLLTLVGDVDDGLGEGLRGFSVPNEPSVSAVIVVYPPEPFQLDASANAPCTSTIVGLASACSARWPVVFTGDLLQCADAGPRARRDDALLVSSTIVPRAAPSSP